MKFTAKFDRLDHLFNFSKMPRTVMSNMLNDSYGRYPAQTQVEHVLYKPPIFQTKTGPDFFQHIDGVIRSSDPAPKHSKA